jgi:hypothetical protein
MRYAIKHAYGVSEDEYQGMLLEPLFGTGQGSGSSPAIWLGLVVILASSMHSIASLLRRTSPALSLKTHGVRKLLHDMLEPSWMIPIKV